MTHRFLKAASGLLIFALAAGSLGAQSVTLTATENATIIGIQSSFGGDGELGVSLGAGYAISSVLELGLRFGADLVPAEESVTSDIGMFYRFAALKQSDEIPVSGQIYGAWTFRSETSDFLTRNRLVHEARGYRLGVTAVRDFFLSPDFALRAGALVEYRNYASTTTVAFDTTGFTGTTEVDYEEYPQAERLAGFEYGGYVGIVMRSEGSGFLFGAAVLANRDASLRLRPDLQVMITR